MFFTDGAAMGAMEVQKSDTLNSTASSGARRRAGGAKKQMQANKSKLRAPRALCCLTLSNPIRMAALALVEWKYPSATMCVCLSIYVCVSNITPLWIPVLPESPDPMIKVIC